MDNAERTWDVPSLVRVVLLALVLWLAAFADERARHEAQALAGDDRAAAEALFKLGQLDETAGDYAQALERYEASLARSPSSRYAPGAAMRIEHLRARSEGDFAPLRRLEQVRQSPALANDPAAIDALRRDAASFPPGRVRVEARMLVAEAYLGRLTRPREGADVLREVLADPKADGLTRRHASRQLVDASIAAGDLDGARAAAAEDAPSAKDVARLRRRRWLHHASIGSLALLAAAVAFALGGAARGRALRQVGRTLRRAAPICLLFAAWVAALGALLASRYESGNPRPFVALGLSVLPIALAARAWGAAGSPARGPRILRGAICACAVAAAGFLVLEAVEPVYLKSFGL